LTIQHMLHRSRASDSLNNSFETNNDTAYVYLRYCISKISDHIVSSSSLSLWSGHGSMAQALHSYPGRGKCALPPVPVCSSRIFVR